MSAASHRSTSAPTSMAMMRSIPTTLFGAVGTDGVVAFGLVGVGSSLKRILLLLGFFNGGGSVASGAVRYHPLCSCTS